MDNLCLKKNFVYLQCIQLKIYYIYKYSDFITKVFPAVRLQIKYFSILTKEF